MVCSGPSAWTFPSIAFPWILARSCSGSKATGSDMKCWHSRQWLKLLCHSTGPRFLKYFELNLDCTFLVHFFSYTFVLTTLNRGLYLHTVFSLKLIFNTIKCADNLVRLHWALQPRLITLRAPCSRFWEICALPEATPVLFFPL